MQKYGQEPKHRSDEHNQASANDFQCLIWIFWVCQLSPMWYNVYCSQLMPQSDCYQLQPDCEALSSKKCPARNFTNYFWHVWVVSATSPYIAQIFVFQLYFYLSWVKHNMSKMLLFLPSSLLKWPTDFLKNTRWYDNSHNTI